MNEFDYGSTDPLWLARTPRSIGPTGRALTQDVACDVCIVGAGIAGATTAYLLAKAGKQVVLLDDSRTMSRQTERTTAHLASQIDDGLAEVERVRGTEAARLAVESHASAIDLIERLVAEENIECDFRRVDGFLFHGEGTDPQILRRELETARRIGWTHVSYTDRAPFDFFDTGPCLRFPQQARIEPVRYLQGLVRAFLAAGGSLYEGVHAIAVEGGMPAQVVTAAGPTVRARAVVVATNSPITNRFALHTKMAPYRSYALAARIDRGVCADALYWDTEDPYHYVRLEKGVGSSKHDWLIVGGEDHKTGQEDECAERYRRLEAWARMRFPRIHDVTYRWSGQVLETLDGLAYIGSNPGDAPNVFVCTGDSGMGMTHGTLGAQLLCELVQGRTHRWSALYDPSRKPVKAGWDYLRENANTAVQYADYVTGGEVSDEASIAPGTGAIVRHGLGKRAVYRTPEGKVVSCSAVCPHLGALVRWNDAEKTWDCPAHGSRFSAEGKCLEGPAFRDLTHSSETAPPKAPPPQELRPHG